MTIAENLQQIHSQIKQAVANINARQEVRLLAVSKTKPCADILAAVQAGQRAFGENYVQEAVEKIQFCKEQNLNLEWHFIGALQSNKTRLVAENFDWCQTVHQSKIAQRLNAQRPAFAEPLNVLIQINIDDEESKSGIAPSQMLELAQLIVSLPNLRLRGLMTIPAPDCGEEVYEQMLVLFKQLQAQLPDQAIDTLSMGMSNDLIPAIQHGSTMVRVGTAIFGARNYTK